MWNVVTHMGIVILPFFGLYASENVCLKAALHFPLKFENDLKNTTKVVW